jgi:hypothetical protein
VYASPTIVIDGDSLLTLNYSEIEWVSQDDHENGTPLPTQSIPLESYGDGETPDTDTDSSGETPDADTDINSGNAENSKGDSSGGCFITSFFSIPSQRL